MQDTRLGSHRLVSLVAEVQVVVDAGHPPADTARAVAGTLDPHLRSPELLLPEHREGDPDRYRQHILHVGPGGCFSIVCLVWLPGQVTPIHDHVSWCVVGVYVGEETEDRFALSADSRRLLTRDTSRNPQGSVAWLTPPGDIHRVRNSGEGAAISIHVYGADISKLGSSIRNEYDLPVHVG